MALKDLMDGLDEAAMEKAMVELGQKFGEGLIRYHALKLAVAAGFGPWTQSESDRTKIVLGRAGRFADFIKTGS